MQIVWILSLPAFVQSYQDMSRGTIKYFYQLHTWFIHKSSRFFRLNFANFFNMI